MATIIQVPTFRGESSVDDSGNDARSTLSQYLPCTEAADKSDDRFLRYSNDEVRLRTLQLGDAPDANSDDDSARRKPIRRKSRISFELHPSAMLEDELMDQLWGGDDDSLGSIKDFLGDEESDSAGIKRLSLRDVTQTDMLSEMELLNTILSL